MDHRGTIRSWPLDQPIIEFNLMDTVAGTYRGFHYHPHFDEYMAVVAGSCRFTEFLPDGGRETCDLATGDCVHIPSNTAHAFLALEDFKFVSLLTRRWRDSDPPIIRVDEDA